MSETSPSCDPDGAKGFDPNTIVPVSLRLHEAIGLAVLYERAPDDLDLTDDHGVWFGGSVDLAMLRIAEAVSKVAGDKNGLLRAGALRAALDQIEKQ